MPTILGANSVTGFDIDNSLMFNDGDSPDLKRLPSSTGQSIKGSLSVWVKFGTPDTEVAILGGFDNSGANDNDGYMVVKRIAAGNLEFRGGDTVYLKTSATFKDCSAWYHIVLGIDTSNGTANNRARMYVNGVEVTSFATRNNLTSLQDLPMNTTAGNDDALLIGADEDTGGKGLHFDGYMADFYWIDQAQKQASDFGEFNNDGVWVPTTYTGSFGVNGVHLEFKETGTSANSSGIGADTSGNDHHFTVTNLGATDVMTDTCTNNFTTLNPLDKAVENTGVGIVLSNANLQAIGENGGNRSRVQSTIGVSSGKWYAEFKIKNGNDHKTGIGIIDVAGANANLGSVNHGLEYRPNADTIQIFDGGSSGASQSSLTGAANDNIVSIALDADASTPTVKFFLQGSQLGNTANYDLTIADRTFFFFVQSVS